MNTILIVDPDERTRFSISNALRSAGFSALTASTGAEARPLLPKASLIITELHLPDGSGLDLSSSLPTIIISSYSSEETLIASLDAGADDFVEKPFNVRELVCRVRAVLRGSRTAKSQTVFKVGPLTVDTESYDVSLDDKKLSLTKKGIRAVENDGRKPQNSLPSRISHVEGLENRLHRGYAANRYPHASFEIERGYDRYSLRGRL